MYLSTRTYKIIVLLLNILCVILGAILSWYGAWLLNSVDDEKYDHGERLAGGLLITLGVILICVEIFGSVVTILGHKGLLIYFAVTLIVLVAVQFIMVSISYSASYIGVAEQLHQGFEELMDRNMHVPNKKLGFYEEWLHCCGKSSADDYFLMDKVPPATCCKERNCANILNLYVNGCEQTYRDYVLNKMDYFHKISWFIIMTEFIDSTFACILIDSIRNHRDRQRFYS